MVFQFCMNYPSEPQRHLRWVDDPRLSVAPVAVVRLPVVLHVFQIGLSQAQRAREPSQDLAQMSSRGRSASSGSSSSSAETRGPHVAGGEPRADQLGERDERDREPDVRPHRNPAVTARATRRLCKSTSATRSTSTVCAMASTRGPRLPGATSAAVRKKNLFLRQGADFRQYLVGLAAPICPDFCTQCRRPERAGRLGSFQFSSRPAGARQARQGPAARPRHGAPTGRTPPRAAKVGNHPDSARRAQWRRRRRRLHPPHHETHARERRRRRGGRRRRAARRLQQAAGVSLTVRKS